MMLQSLSSKAPLAAAVADRRRRTVLSVAPAFAFALAVVLFCLPARAVGLVGSETNSLAVGDFDGDGGTDYAYGYPNWSFGEGKVVVVYDDDTIQIWNRDAWGILLSDANYNYFGDSIAAGDFDGDGYDDIAVGVPGDDHEGTNAGSIHVIYGTSNGLDDLYDQVIDLQRD